MARLGSGKGLLQGADFSLCPHVEIAERKQALRGALIPLMGALPS